MYDGRTQQKGRAANDDQEGAQESSLGGEGDGCVWKCSVSYSGRLHTRTHGSTGIKLYIERRLHLIVCELNSSVLFGDIPVLVPGEFHGQKSLVGYSP